MREKFLCNALDMHKRKKCEDMARSSNHLDPIQIAIFLIASLVEELLDTLNTILIHLIM
jgi:hypothetical protein